MSAPRARPSAADLALVAVLYFGAARLGALTVMPEGIAVFWPPNGIVLAALIRFGARRWPALAAVVVAAEVAADLPAFGLVEALLFGAINFGEAILAWLALRRLGFDPSFGSLADLWKFVLAGPAGAAACAALAGAAVYSAFRGGDTGYLEFARIWWFGDGLGLLIVTPLLLGFPPFAPSAAAPGRRLDAWDAGFWAALSLGAAAVALRAFPLVAVLVLLVLYAAARYPPRWAALAVALASVVIVLAMHGGGRPFGALAPREAVILAQETIFLLGVTGLGFSALLGRLRAQQAELEARVAERTAALSDANRRLESLAATDPVTELANRRRFDEALAAEIERCRRYGGTVSLVLADVDRFKGINDTYGHGAGDQVLRAYARVLRQAARAPDLVARFGGDEFAVLMPQTAIDQAAEFAGRAQAALGALRVPPIESPLSASFGVVAWHAGEDPAALLARADAALYEAKRAGRDRVVRG